jgi:beta-glucosidase
MLRRTTDAPQIGWVTTEPDAIDALWWGTTTAAVSAEGAAPASTWARWEHLGRVPPSGEGDGFATNYARDWAMLAEHGLTRHGLTVEWARIEPRPGEIDGDAVEHLLDVLRTAGQAGIEVWATLLDVTLPGWFADDTGGLLDDRARTYYWPRHVDRMGELLGDLVAGWIPVEDPFGLARDGWLAGTRPPGQRAPDLFVDALRAAHLANLDAERLLRSGDRPVASSFALLPVSPVVRSREPDERERAAVEARRLDRLAFGTWTELLDEGRLSLPGRAAEELPGAAGAFDLVGVSYDHAVAVYADGSTGPYPTDGRVGPTGWSPQPEELGRALRRVHDAVPRRNLLVTGFGLPTRADDPLQDEWRVEVLQASVDQLTAAVADGVPVRGALHRCAVDGYEWEHGFGVHRGVFDRDRRPKESALVLARAAGVTPTGEGIVPI